MTHDATDDTTPTSTGASTNADPVAPPERRWRRVSRRLLLGAGLGTGALLVGVPSAIESLRPRIAETLLSSGIGDPEVPGSPLVWFELTAEAIGFWVPKVEMGQGIHTALAVIAADELGVLLEQLQVRQADPVQGFAADTLFTFGSTSVSGLYRPIREAAATVRTMLAAEAGRLLGVAPDRLTVADGRFTAGDRSVTHLEAVAAHTGAWTMPAAVPPLQPRRGAGSPARRVEMRDKLTGRATYGYDARLEGMAYGAVATPPRFGDRLTAADTAAAEALPGVERVLIDLDAGLAGVVADTRTRAWAAVAALRLTWEGGTRASVADLEAMLVPGDGAEIRREGSVSNAFAGGITVDAEYVTPLAAHAHLEPLAALARVEPGGRIEVWVPTQAPDTVRSDLAAVFGEEREIVVRITQLGGSFGRKAGQHLAVEAARLAEAVGRPVHVGYTREQDLGNGFYRPPTRTRLWGALVDGRIRGVQQATAGGDIIWAVAGLPEAVRDVLGMDPGGLLGQFLPYEIGGYRVVNRREQLPVPCGPWRGLGLLPDTFATESFVDELAEAAGADPLAFRLDHLPDDDTGRRLRTVLERAAADSGWDTPPAPGRGRGIACSGENGTVVAMATEVELQGTTIVVTGVWVAVDCGLVIDSAGAALQARGSVIMGLSSTLVEELQVADGRVTSTNFDRYPILRLDQAPPIEVAFVGEGTEPSGMGEPVIGPVAAAVANAVRAAGGPRVRRLPLRL